VVTVGVCAAKHGVHGYAAGSFSPTTGGFLAVTPIVLFAVVGFEAQNGAAEEMRNPAKDVPVSVAVSGTVSALCYLMPIFGILAVVPASKVFTVVLSIAVSTLLLSYLVIFPTIVRLRRRYPTLPRPYRIPGGRAGLWVCAVLIYAWVLLGSWLSVFPGTIEPVLGIKYDFAGTWGVSRLTFEAFTLGTLLAIVVFCTLGYWWAQRRGDAGADFTADLQRELLTADQA